MKLNGADWRTINPLESLGPSLAYRHPPPGSAWPPSPALPQRLEQPLRCPRPQASVLSHKMESVFHLIRTLL